jgi:hypothetical protein
MRFLGAFAKLRKMSVCFVILSVCPSVRPHGTTRIYEHTDTQMHQNDTTKNKVETM